MENNYTDIQQAAYSASYSPELYTNSASSYNTVNDISSMNPMDPLTILSYELTLQAQYDELENQLLMRNYPPLCQKIQFYINRYLDSQDYSTSPIYAVYPSKATIDHMIDMIYMEIKDDSPDTLREFDPEETPRYPRRSILEMLIQPLLLNELYKRRMRKYIYTLCSTPTMTGI